MVPGESQRVQETGTFLIVEFGFESGWDGEDNGTRWVAGAVSPSIGTTPTGNLETGCGACPDATAQRLRQSGQFAHTDDHDVSHIPAWVKTAKQTTDGHLAQLAKSKSAVLETLDERIRRAFIIPTQR
jgi:hypothetical protein